MTRREFWAQNGATWKGHILREIGSRNRLPYDKWRMHVMVSRETLFVKTALFRIKLSDNALAYMRRAGL